MRSLDDSPIDELPASVYKSGKKHSHRVFSFSRKINAKYLWSVDVHTKLNDRRNRKTMAGLFVLGNKRGQRDRRKAWSLDRLTIIIKEQQVDGQKSTLL